VEHSQADSRTSSRVSRNKAKLAHNKHQALLKHGKASLVMKTVEQLSNKQTNKELLDVGIGKRVKQEPLRMVLTVPRRTGIVHSQIDFLRDIGCK
jgi:stress response protein YsnF